MKLSTVTKTLTVILLTVASLFGQTKADFSTQIKNKPFIYAKDYMKLNSYVVWTATITSASNIVTCAACHFLTQAKVGQTVFATNVSPFGYIHQFTSTVILPETTILSVDSDTQIHATVNATASSVVDANHAGGVLVWGDLDDTGATNAWTATVNACGTLVFPALNANNDGAAIALFHQAHFSTVTASGLGTAATCSLGTEGMRRGVGVQGQSMNAATMIPTPLFDSSTCTYGNSAHACFFSVADGLVLSNIVLWGVGNSNPGSRLTITQATRSGSNTIYAYTVAGGPTPKVGDPVVTAGFVNSGNNGTFTITALGGTTTFTVVNTGGVTETHAATGIGTFLNLVAVEINPKAKLNTSTSGNNSIDSVTIMGWGADNSGTTGNGIGTGIMFDGGSADSIVNFMEDGAGRTGCDVTPPYTFHLLRCVDNPSTNLYIEAGGSGGVQSFGGTFGSTNNASGGGDCSVSTFNNFYSFGDLIGDTFPAANGLCVGYRNTGSGNQHHAAQAFLFGSTVNVSGTGATGITTCGTTLAAACGSDTGNVFLTDSSITGVATAISNYGNIRNHGGNDLHGTALIGCSGASPNCGGNYEDVTSAVSVASPTCSSTTGGGSPGATCTFDGNSQNTGGIIILTTGTTPSSAGTITLSFATITTPLGGGGTAAGCQFNALDGTGGAAGTWGNGVNVRQTSASNTSIVLAWSNWVSTTLTNLIAAKTYRISYVCYPK